MVWILLWWAFCALLIFGVLTMFRMLNRQKFRDSIGDITSEVGYEEDSVGNVIQQEFGAGSIPDAGDAHISTGSGHIEGTTLMG